MGFSDGLPCLYAMGGRNRIDGIEQGRGFRWLFSLCVDEHDAERLSSQSLLPTQNELQKQVRDDDGRDAPAAHFYTPPCRRWISIEP